MNHLYLLTTKNVNNKLGLESSINTITNFIKLHKHRMHTIKIDRFNWLFLSSKQLFIFYVLGLNLEDSKTLSGFLTKDRNIICLKHYSGFTTAKTLDIFENIGDFIRHQSISINN